MPTIPERLETATAEIEADKELLHDIVNGAVDDPDVETEGGPVKPVAKAIEDAIGDLTEAIETTEGYKDAAAISATTATTGATTATAQAVIATTQATSATASATAAQTAQTAAEAAQTAAVTARTAAQAAQAAAETAQAAALVSQTAAAASASGAATSATNAATSATAANTAKVAAQTAQTAAETAQAAAVTARTAAETAQTAAAASATAAAASATAAGNSQTAAATSATNAANSATAAATSATNAANSATAAATSATNAAASATTATTQATAAAASAAAALTSQNAAATSATTATTQATNAATSATAAATSQTAAAASATSAANAVANGFLGVIAGGSVPATAASAGKYYIISSAGTSQSVTWAFGDWAIYNGSSGSWSRLPNGAIDETGLSNYTNTRSRRPGVVFDTSSSGRATTYLVNQNIATDVFSVSFIFKVPLTVPSAYRGVFALSSNATGMTTVAGLKCEMQNGNGGAFEIVLYGASAGDFNHTNFYNIVTRFAGKDILVTFVRNAAGAPSIYINKVLQTPDTDTTSGTAPTWQGSITSTYLHTGFCVWAADTTFGAMCFANVAFSQTDVVEIVENGGAIPERYKWGNQVNFLSGNDVDFAGAGNWIGNGTTVATVTGGKLVVTGITNSGSNCLLSPTWAQSVFATLPPIKRRLRVTFDVAAITFGGAATAINVFSAIYSNSTPIGSFSTTGAKSFEFDYISGGGAGSAMLSFTRNETSGQCDVTIDNVKIKTIGAICFYSYDGGAGPQARDESSNELDADKTIAGVFEVQAAPIGTKRQIRKTYAHSDISSTGATTTPGWLPAGWIVVEVQANVTTAFDASTTFDFGISGTNAKFVTALAVSTTGFKRSVSSSLVPESATANTVVYIKKNQATTAGAVKVVWIIERIF